MQPQVNPQMAQQQMLQPIPPQMAPSYPQYMPSMQQPMGDLSQYSYMVDPTQMSQQY